ncbi:head maturation protease, ClpP-related [Nonomuraea sp. bgisy101]|uniref:head maturation protease, ClpP-related n=1 Tax=Nonomuraea sp. bgisy101 TaxID=3413784 RepID=UPI003D724159
MNKTLRPLDPALVTRVQAFLAQRDARALPNGFVRPQAKVTATEGGGAELMIYDEISYWGVCATDVAAALASISGDLHVRINSPGGDVFDGLAIYNMLIDYPGQVTVTVDGLAASAASFIAMAGDRVVMNRGSQAMIHDASGLCWGNAADMKAMAALLDQVSTTLASIYAARAGGDIDTWRTYMRDETWYTAEAAVEAGLADELVPHPSRDQEPTAVATVAAPAPDQAPAPTAPSLPVAAALPPIAEQQEPVPASPTPAPTPSPVAEVDETPVSPGDNEPPDPVDEPVTDDWADTTAHLITPPSTEDEWESLREALL